MKGELTVDCDRLFSSIGSILRQDMESRLECALRWEDKDTCQVIGSDSNSEWKVLAISDI